MRGNIALQATSWLRCLRQPSWSHPKGTQVAESSWLSCRWWLSPDTWPEEGGSPRCPIGLPFPPLHPGGPAVPPTSHLPNRQATHEWGVAGPEPGGPLETLPRFFCSLWDFLPGPSELAVHLKPKPKGGTTRIQYSGKRFTIRCVCVLKGRTESAHLLRETGTRTLPTPQHPCPNGHLEPQGVCRRHPCVCPQSSMRELVESGRYDTREDFSVVLQPFFYNIQLPILAVGSLPSLTGLPKGGENSRQKCQVLP